MISISKIKWRFRSLILIKTTKIKFNRTKFFNGKPLAQTKEEMQVSNARRNKLVIATTVDKRKMTQLQ